MDGRERRLTRNEVVFREVNERIERTARSLDEDGRYEFLCECSDVECDERISLTLPEYEFVRGEPARFVVLDGHHVADVERIVGRIDDYAVVEKEGEAGRYASALDPRSA